MSAPEQWIPSYLSLPRHPKTKRLQRILNLDTRAAVGALHLFWYWAFEFAPDGDVTDFAEDIRDAMAVEADALPALVASGFVDRSSDGRHVIHDWPEYVGKILARRAKDAARKRADRQGTSGDVPRTSEGHPAMSADTSEEIRGQEKREETPLSDLRSDGAVVKVRKRKSDSEPDGFAAFYLAYPRHTARAAAAKAWSRLSPADRAAATAALPRHAEHFKTRDADKIPHPATWLNGRRWEDEIPTNGNGGQPHAQPQPAARCDRCGGPDPQRSGTYAGTCFDCAFPMARTGRAVHAPRADNGRPLAEVLGALGRPPRNRGCDG